MKLAARSFARGINKMKKTFTILFTLILTQGFAQVDAHFSQYYAHPLWLNPAMTGAFNGSLRVAGIYRSQWGSITNAFSTSGLSADVVTGKNLNIGVSLLNQTAGDAGYRYMNGSISFAYTGVRFGKEESQQLVIALQAGFLNRRFDASKFQFGDQWNPSIGFDPSIQTSDLLTKTSATALDAGAGIAWLDRTEDKLIAPFAGFSVMHLTKPEDPFIAGSKTSLPMRYSFHGGARISISSTTSITPNILYMRQGNTDEKMVGAAAAIAVNESSDLLFGINYRIGDALSPFAGLRYQKITFGLSYDNNISNLGKMSGQANSFECSLSFIVPKSEYKGIPCPVF